MELSADLIALQSILTSLVKSTEYTKIYHKGGNEGKILSITTEIYKFLTSKCYLKNNKINEEFDQQLEYIVLFLAINTRFKRTFELPEYEHLMNIIPPLSKCIFVNIVYGLDLCKYCCRAMNTLPIEVSAEILDEINQCLAKAKPKVHLEYAYMFIKAAADKLDSVDYSIKMEDYIDDLTEVSNIMLRNLTGLYSDQTKNMNSSQIYQHMGYCLMYLFDLLLLFSDKKCANLKKFIGNIITACCSIVKNVTINVYCEWAEVDIDDDQVLQSIVSEKAYSVIETYQKNSDARELISLLSTIARKPLTVAELIQKSDIKMIIKKVDKTGPDQKTWFQALLNNQIFKNKDVVECVERWAHLCNEENVSLLINLCIQTNDEASKKLVIKCASSLNFNQLHIVLTKHFYRNKFSNPFKEDIESDLMIIFNKLNDTTMTEDGIKKELSLLLLQNPCSVFRFIYKTCLRNTYYTDCLESTFTTLEEISKIGHVGITTLNEVLDEFKWSEQNIKNLSYLLKRLISINYFSTDLVIPRILYPLLKKYYVGKHLEDISFVLQVFLDGQIIIPVRSSHDILEMCLKIMQENRCKFLKFVNINQHIAGQLTDLFLDLCEVTVNSSTEGFEVASEDDLFTNYYKKFLFSNLEDSFFTYICPGFDVNDNNSCIPQLLQVLPLAVTREWLCICDEILNRYGCETCLELLTNVMILLSELVTTQNHLENQQVYAALKYYLQNFGLVIQQKIQNNSDLDTEIHVTRQVCRLIAKLPTCFKEEEGLSLVNILTTRSLKVLGKDKEFLCLLMLIKNSKVCKVLAEKIKE